MQRMALHIFTTLHSFPAGARYCQCEYHFHLRPDPHSMLMVCSRVTEALVRLCLLMWSVLPNDSLQRWLRALYVLHGNQLFEVLLNTAHWIVPIAIVILLSFSAQVSRFIAYAKNSNNTVYYMVCSVVCVLGRHTGLGTGARAPGGMCSPPKSSKIVI